ncbi:hypothetical protein [Marinobacter adhaerens]|uniref:hypothetical protein n=1 Tax=Marinobacter adhaerens TaxID=1033846 RepID=UPI003D0CA7C0
MSTISGPPYKKAKTSYAQIFDLSLMLWTMRLLAIGLNLHALALIDENRGSVSLRHFPFQLESHTTCLTGV